MSQFIDLTGQRFGRLTVIERSTTKICGCTAWACLCDCGNMVTVRGAYLRNGTTKSCGCLSREMASARFTKLRASMGADGRSKTRLYKIYRGMVCRCTSKTNQAYPRYGGRGIYVCEEWKADYNAFRDWSMSHGFVPEDMTLSLDRIDNDGPYSPENCRWVTMLVQSNNMSTNRRLTFMGKTLSVSQWARETGISRGTIVSRLRAGWPVSEALSAPIDERYSTKRKNKG